MNITDRLNGLIAVFHLNGKKLVQYFPFLFIGVLIALKAVSFGAYWTIMAAEDGPAEYLTSLAYLLASGIAIRIWWRLDHHWREGMAWMAIACAFVFFLVAMEEISWGQRIFAVQSPEFFETYNYQGEITLHNFLSRYPLHMAYILAGLYGAFSWKWFPQRWREKFPSITPFLIPDRHLKWYFLPAALLYFYYDYLSVLLVNVLGLSFFQWQSGSNHWIIAKDQEPIELLMAMGVMCFMASLMNRQTHGTLATQSSATVATIH